MKPQNTQDQRVTIEMRRSFWVRGRGWGRRGATRNWGEDGNGLHLVLGGGYTSVKFTLVNI